MIKFKKSTAALSAIFILILTLALFTACNAGNTEAEGSTAESEIPDCEHTSYVYVINTPATCSATGTKYKKCGDCGKTFERETTPTIAHTPEIIPSTSATCSTPGLTEGKRCSICRATLVAQTETATIPHTEKIIPGVNATCSASGLTEGKECTVCNTVLVEQATIPTVGHIPVSTNVLPTCTTEGAVNGIKCASCDAEIRPATTLPALGHKESEWVIDSAASTEAEGRKHTACRYCFEEMQVEAIPTVSADHVHESAGIAITKLGSCQTIEVLAASCSCGYVFTTLNTTLAHPVKIAVDEIPATCAEAGSTAGEICAVCGVTVSGKEPTEKLEHTKELLQGIAPTCQSFGMTEGEKCSACQEILLERTTLAKEDHIPVSFFGKDATCTESGITGYSSCAVCKTALSSGIVIHPAGHSFSSGVCTECGIAEPYGILITDGTGAPVSNVFIKIMQNGEQVKLVSYNGKFLAIDLPIGTYTLEIDLSQLDKEYVFDESLCTLTPSAPSTAITLYRPASDPTSIFVGAPILSDYNAHTVELGSHKANLTAGDYTFFIFHPTAPGVYSINCKSDSAVSYSYHGSTFFVQGADLSENTADVIKTAEGLEITVFSDNMGSDYVFAISSETAKECTVNVKKIGEAGSRPDDEPWIPYLEEQSKVNEQLSMKPEGTYTPIDLTDLTLSAVLNSADGYYHLGSVNGPIIYIDLTSDTKYISSIKTICSHQRMGAIISDVNGKIIEKRNYNDLFAQYGMPLSEDESVSSPIRVPLTAKLAEAIKSFGEQNHWWDPMSEMNIFTSVLMGAPYNSRYAWLLFCGYYK